MYTLIGNGAATDLPHLPRTAAEEFLRAVSWSGDNHKTILGKLLEYFSRR
jgi:hypothetical protein